MTPRNASVQRVPVSRTAQKRLRHTKVGHLATIDPDGRPHLVPVCFVYDGKALYTPIDRKPKRAAPAKLARVRNIRAMPGVAFLIDEYQEDWTQLWYVLIRGRASVLPASARRERAAAIRRLRTKYPQYSLRMLADDAQIIRITPERITSWPSA